MLLQDSLWQLQHTAASTGITINIIRISFHSLQFGGAQNPCSTHTLMRVNMKDIPATMSPFIGKREQNSLVFGFLPETRTRDRQHKPYPLAGNSRFAERDTGDPQDLRRKK